MPRQTTNIIAYCELKKSLALVFEEDFKMPNTNAAVNGTALTVMDFKMKWGNLPPMEGPSEWFGKFPWRGIVILDLLGGRGNNTNLDGYFGQDGLLACQLLAKAREESTADEP